MSEDYCKEQLDRLSAQFEKLDEKFDKLFQNGPISTLDKRVTLIEDKARVAGWATGGLLITVGSYLILEFVKHFLGV